MYIRFKDGKAKAFTLSYDDGVVQDIRLIEIFNKYGLKGTFNINSGLYLKEDEVREKFYGRMKLSEAKDLYIGSGQEVAVHSYSHPFLEQLKEPEMVYEITEDRKNLEEQFETIVRGMAYPMGTYSDTVVGVLKNCGICYSRTTKSTGTFYLPQNWLTLHPTCHHDDPKLMEYAEIFAEDKNPWLRKPLFYVWGHSYEFDGNDNWDRIEKLAEYMSGREDIWYATNIEIYDYVKAYDSLQMSWDKKIITNLSAIDVWAEDKGEVLHIKAGETIRR